MGIKLFVERRTCPKCTNGILLPYAWKTCEKHDRTKSKPRVKKEKPSLTHLALSSFDHIDRVYKVPNALKGMDFKNKDYLVYDPATMEIIGWK